MRLFYKFCRSLLKVFFSLFYKIKIYGLQELPLKGAIIAPNHASFFDPPVIAAVFPEEVHFLARGGLFRNPFFRWLISSLNAHPISFNNDISSMKLITKLLKEDKKVVIFPEGSRTPDGSLTPIKSGIGMLALKSQVPIIPVYIHGTFEVWNKGRRFPKFTGNRISCVFGKPIEWNVFSHLDKKLAQEEISKRIKFSLEQSKHWLQSGAKGLPP